jgi:hypothetical protein
VLLVVAVAMMLIANCRYLDLRQRVGSSISSRQVRTLAPPRDCDRVDNDLAIRLRSRGPSCSL